MRMKLSSMISTVILFLAGWLAGTVAGQEVASDVGLDVGREFRDCNVCPTMVVVPAGDFEMGASHAGGSAGEGPVHRVKVPAFEIGQNKVTFVEFNAFLDATGQERLDCPSRWRQLAVGCIAWDDAVQYTTWLSRMTGRRYRLPSESEWEFVARHTAWLGVSGMIGNGREWVIDCWHADYRGAPADGGGWEVDGDCSRRVVRGELTVSGRLGIGRQIERDDHGFRVARTLD